MPKNSDGVYYYSVLFGWGHYYSVLFWIPYLACVETCLGYLYLASMESCSEHLYLASIEWVVQGTIFTS